MNSDNEFVQRASLRLYAPVKIIESCMCGKSVEGVWTLHMKAPHDIVAHVAKLEV